MVLAIPGEENGRFGSPRPRWSAALVLAYLGFVSLGLPDGLLGVAWPTMSAGFGVPVSAVAAVTVPGTAGAVPTAPSAPGAPADGRGVRSPLDSAVVGQASSSWADVRAVPRLWLGPAAFAVYAGVQVAAGLWAYPLLTAGRGLAPGAAAGCVAGYWGCLFAGRLLSGALADRVCPGRMLRLALGGLVAGGSLVALPGPGWLAAAGLALVGSAAAPVFPLLILGTGARVGPAYAHRVIGLQVAAAALGGAALPAAFGLPVQRGAVEALGPALTLAALVLASLHAGFRPVHRD